MGNRQVERSRKKQNVCISSGSFSCGTRAESEVQQPRLAEELPVRIPQTIAQEPMR
jgi:hypothetical protein